LPVACNEGEDVEAQLMNPESPGELTEAKPEKRKYEKPRLFVHGTLGELTQSGGNRHHDGLFTRKLS
jgi:hypothetical protein